MKNMKNAENILPLSDDPEMEEYWEMLCDLSCKIVEFRMEYKLKMKDVAKILKVSMRRLRIILRATADISLKKYFTLLKRMREYEDCHEKFQEDDSLYINPQSYGYTPQEWLCLAPITQYRIIQEERGKR